VLTPRLKVKVALRLNKAIRFAYMQADFIE